MISVKYVREIRRLGTLNIYHAWLKSELIQIVSIITTIVIFIIIIIIIINDIIITLNTKPSLKIPFVDDVNASTIAWR